MQSLIIIGAPRSGTNMLRDMLCLLDGVETWPCDEINYIWRHGNIRYPSDEFLPEMATSNVSSFVRNEFSKLALKTKAKVVVEKTCANSLRVGYVDNIVNDAKYIFIIRDGVDVVASAMKRWRAPVDVPYLLKKARYIPLIDIPYYAVKFILNYLYKIFNKEKRLAFWGPILAGMNDILARHDVAEVCALQWKRCVEKAEQDFRQINPKNILYVKYEDFVFNPVAEYERIADFIGESVPEDVKDMLIARISKTSVGQGRASLDSHVKEKVVALISDTLARHGYDQM